MACRRSVIAARNCWRYAARNWATVRSRPLRAAVTPGVNGGEAGGGVTPGAVNGATTVTMVFGVLPTVTVARTSRSSRLASVTDGRNATRFLLRLFMVQCFLN